jgi:anti-anti-sigma regulatory factor
MGRIRSERKGAITRVIITGDLTAVDMGRLERACAPALVAHPPPLEIDLRGVASADRTAAAVLAQFVHRGARIIGGASVLHRE